LARDSACDDALLPGAPSNADDASAFALRASTLLTLDEARLAQLGQRWLPEILRLISELEDSGAAGGIDQMRSVYERLILLTEGWAGLPAIHQVRASVLVLATERFGAAALVDDARAPGIWQDAFVAEWRLDAVARHFPSDREIQLHRARGAFNALRAYGEGARAASDPASAERLWDRMAAAEERLDAVASAFPDDQEIRLWRAMGAVNLMAAYDAGAPRARDLRSGARNALAKAARDFPNDLKIQELASQIGVSFVQQLAGLRPPPRPE
jgi:hypothetical protein